MLHRVVWKKFTDVSEMLVASIIRKMMEATSTSETSVNFYQTIRRNIPEDSHLHTRRRENLKSHLFSFQSQWPRSRWYVPSIIALKQRWTEPRSRSTAIRLNIVIVTQVNSESEKTRAGIEEEEEDIIFVTHNALNCKAEI
jgi:hypothetical protein